MYLRQTQGHIPHFGIGPLTGLLQDGLLQDRESEEALLPSFSEVARKFIDRL
jgi:hypothetical protein